MSDFERVLEIVKNFLVIITCLVLLYLLVAGYMALSEFADRMSRLGEIGL